MSFWQTTILVVASLAFAAASSTGAAAGFSLNDMADVAEVQLPEQSRAEIPDPVPVTGSWRLVTTVAGVRTWETNLPVRPRTLFFHRAPDDMALLQAVEGKEGWDKARKIRFSDGLKASHKKGTWSFTSHALHVRRPVESGPPPAGAYAVRYTRAV